MPREIVTDFEHLKQPVHTAIGEEIHMFTHIHLRGYDKNGDGKQMHADYYDKYGAPMKIQDSWLEGYRAVERELAEHFNGCLNPALPFPAPGASAGGSHLYEMHHFDKPWNWTGFVPEQKKWCCFDKFFQNRHFIALRGNEVQNNLWNYDPHEENEGADCYDHKYEQVIPIDEYRDGYFFFKNPWGRYLHIISLKSMTPQHEFCKRYNYIVHPLAYRADVATLPDDSVDAMQWTIVNCNSQKFNRVPEGKSKATTFPAFGQDQLDRWGDKCHGLEIFNDFTYYYSASPLNEGNDDKWLGGNGYLHDEPGTSSNNFIHWFNSYPHEMAEFLAETAFRHGTYIQMLSANDAMYQRNEVEVQFADPKSSQTSKLVTDFKRQPMATLKRRAQEKLRLTKGNTNEEDCTQHLGKMPYQCDTVFGYVTLVDPEMNVKQTIYGQPPYNSIAKLDEGELKILDLMIEGKFYSHTGVYEIFDYRNAKGDIIQYQPISVGNQNPKEHVITYHPEIHDLTLTLPKAKPQSLPKPSHRDSIQEDIIWQVTYELHKTKTNTIECHRGYFKLDENNRTTIDLRSFVDEKELAWIRVQGYDTKNPQRRAWFQAIRGPMFGKIDLVGNDKTVLNPLLTNTILTMAKSVATIDGEQFSVYKPTGVFKPDTMASANLCFDFQKTTDEDMLLVYNLQVHSHKQQAVANSCRQSPPTYLQNICGVLSLSELFPTRLDLNSSWDKATVKDNQCHFYLVDKQGSPLSLGKILIKPKSSRR